MSETGQPQPLQMYQRMRIAAIIVLLAMASLVAAAALTPLSSDSASMLPAGRPFEPMPPAAHDIQPLLVRMAGQQLIRPAQVRAAVKDNGAAQRLLKQLKLQGVIASGGQYVAYIRIDKQPVRSVRQGDQVLELTVDKVEPGRVQLSLEGVTVDLTH